jgi:hypothetical protein
MNNTQELTKGIFVSFKKVIKKLTIGAAISLLITLLIRFIEISFGYAWEEGLTYLFLSYGYLIATTAQSVYMAFRGYLKEGIYYIIGWALGSVILVSFGVITSSIFYDSLIIPSAVIIVKIIFILIKKRKNNSVAIKRHSP